MPIVSKAVYEPTIRTATAQPAGSGVHFETLDALRGICAILVAMMHFPASGPIGESDFIRNSWMFVDYFFVLSGFVIAHRYANAIADGATFARFAVLRLARIYPLHALVLLAFLALEVLRWSFPQVFSGSEAAFSGRTSWTAMISSLLLLNGTGLESSLVWNGLSWSISAEFWAYMMFAAAVLLLGRRHWLAMLPFVVAGPLVIILFAPRLMDSTFDFGLLRCLYGFAAGALLHRFAAPQIIAASRELRATAISRPDWAWTFAETAALVMIYVFVALFAPTAVGVSAPFLFAFALYIFAHEAGHVSRLLRTRPFLAVGAMSYAIYIVQAFVQGRLIDAATLVGALTGQTLTGPFVMNGLPFEGFGVAGPFFGTAMFAVMLAVVLAVAWIAHLFVEKPVQRFVRRRILALEERRAQRERDMAPVQATFGNSRVASRILGARAAN